jgi:hypothetical protein
MSKETGIKSSLATKIRADVDVALNDTASRTNDGRETEKPEESEVCYESEDYQVLESALVLNDEHDSVSNEGMAIIGADPDQVSEISEVPWSSRTSFTADSPYFDAFVSSEMENFNVLSDTLNGIALHTREFVKQGAILSDVTKRLSLACKLRSPDYSDDQSAENDLAATAEEDLIRQRRSAVGEEMGGILELLAEVRSGFLLFRLLWSFTSSDFNRSFYLVGF